MDHLFKTGNTFGWYLDIPPQLHSDPAAAAEDYIRGRHHSWRRIISSLDKFDRTAIADELMPYAEPPAGIIHVNSCTYEPPAGIIHVNSCTYEPPAGIIHVNSCTYEPPAGIIHVNSCTYEPPAGIIHVNSCTYEPPAGIIHVNSCTYMNALHLDAVRSICDHIKMICMYIIKKNYFS